MTNKKPQADELLHVDLIFAPVGERVLTSAFGSDGLGDEFDIELNDKRPEGDLHLEAQMKDPEVVGHGPGHDDEDEDEDEDDFIDELDEAYRADIEDAAEAELENLLRETGGASLQQRIGGVSVFL
ncbi:hypothetical protein, partial [Pseudomonas savastanoi]